MAKALKRMMADQLEQEGYGAHLPEGEEAAGPSEGSAAADPFADPFAS